MPLPGSVFLKGSTFHHIYAKRLKMVCFYDKRLKKVLCKQLNNKFSQNQWGLNPPLQNLGGVATPQPPAPCLAPVC